MQVDSAEVLRALVDGELLMLGMMPWSSNYTFLVQVNDEHYSAAADRGERAHISVDGQSIEADLLAVYKPQKGENPLWDFPEGTLCLREYAAYQVSTELSWNVVPPTVLRNGPQGLGSVQLYVDADPNQHYFNFRDNETVTGDLQRMVLFDLITNNADRKSGHCLLDTTGHVWGIDHGITFNTDYKLRTVVWDFANQEIPEMLLNDLRGLQKSVEADRPLGRSLRQLLTAGEVKAFRRRIDGLISLGHFPSPSRNQRSVPWPPV